MTWRLHSGVELHESHPNTFWIPPEDERNHLVEGDYAKLVFTGVRVDGGPAGERMWVCVTGRDGDTYVGTLASHPVAIQLNWGDEVRFHADNVINISRE